MAAASPPPSPPAAKRPKMSSSSDPEADAEPTSPSAAGDDPGQPRRPRYKRRKVAILLGYCGAGYQGMQKNPGARTIEGDLEEALYQAGAVPEADRAAPRRYDWARAARTDKGVSAAAQVVSGRFYVDPPGFIDRLNAQLAPQIRAYGYVRVTNSFSAKKFCDRRRYLYLLPVFALDPSAHPDREAVMASMGSGSELTKCLECSERGRKVPGVMGREGKLPSPGENGADVAMDGTVDSHDESGSIGAAKCDPTITDGGKTNSHGELGLSSNEKLDLPVSGDGTEAGNAELGSNDVDDVVPSGSSDGDASIGNEVNKLEAAATEDKVQGMDFEMSNGEEKPPTKSAFSYTEKVKEKFNRILKYYVGTHNFHNFTTRTKAEDPAAKRFIISFAADRVVSLDGIDFVRCEVLGQSFMLHQIRKMIGLAVAVMRNCAPESIYDVSFRKDVNLNVPTAPEVGLYLDECMFTSYNKKWKDSHEAVSMEPYCEEAEEFKVKYIFPHIAAMEHKEGAVALWLHSLNHRNYPDFCYMETAGAEAKVGADVESSAAGAEAKIGAEVENIEEVQIPSNNEVQIPSDNVSE
ncbi:tRNA pseudouridine synthase A, mitochondrial [Dichanthelium oligosanthes]|uniref:tRNA pseudouridine synthase A, mitochondrial n=1 Tax=Dichanthelium oligosanthes TaxID=888268 RepID=A0A1E5VZ56_9POAL|nr:tRNA pseudouridine synthase A, mitochondrial [Dichanthelium oligosanthes]